MLEAILFYKAHKWMPNFNRFWAGGIKIINPLIYQKDDILFLIFFIVSGSAKP